MTGRSLKIKRFTPEWHPRKHKMRRENKSVKGS